MRANSRKRINEVTPPTSSETTPGNVAATSHTREGLHLRDATVTDIDRVNAIVGRAMKSWRLSKRVLRLSLPLYRYHEQDLNHQQIVLAETASGTLAGMAAIESADSWEKSTWSKPALLHGLYVDPVYHRLGIGSELLEHVEDVACSAGYDSLLIRANSAATGFFQAHGLQQLPIENPDRDYPHRFWKAL